MAPSLLGSWALFAVAVNALAYPGPRETAALVIPADAQSPRPTIGPALHQYLKRQSNEQTVLVAPDNTCGYVSGQSAAVYTCVDSTNHCVFVTALDGGAGAAGCCNNNECGFRVACLDYEQIVSSSLCDANCKADSFTEKCSNTAARYCNTIIFANSVTDYFCNSVSLSTGQRADTTYSGQTGRTFLQTVLTISTESTTRLRSDSTSSTASQTATVTAPPAPSNSSTPVGAIVGGVVGGVAVLGLIGLGLFFLKRKAKKPAGPPPPPHETQQLNPGYPQPGTPGHPPQPGTPGTPGFAPGKAGHQSVQSAYSSVPPYATPSPHQQAFGQYPQQPSPSFYPPQSYDHPSGLGTAYDETRAGSTSPHQSARFSGQSGYGAQASTPAPTGPVPVEIEGRERRGPVHELM
ncbi:hypothetical protein OQA88_12352 [Cercophora sp. LCS_1]